VKYTVVLTAALPAIARTIVSQDCDVVEHPTEEARTEEDMMVILGEADAAIVLSSDPITRAVLEANPNLRMVANFGVETGNVDMAAARESGVVVTNAPAGDAGAMARAAATDVIRFLRGLEPVHRVA
jgi:glyoxylate reductase